MTFRRLTTEAFLCIAIAWISAASAQERQPERARWQIAVLFSTESKWHTTSPSRSAEPKRDAHWVFRNSSREPISSSDRPVP